MTGFDLKIFVVAIILAVDRSHTRRSVWSQATNSMTSQHQLIVGSFCKLDKYSITINGGFVKYQQFLFECTNLNNVIFFTTSQCPRTCTNPVTCAPLDTATYRVVKKMKIVQFETLEGAVFNVKVVDRCACEAKRKCRGRIRRKRNKTLRRF